MSDHRRAQSYDPITRTCQQAETIAKFDWRILLLAQRDEIGAKSCVVTIAEPLDTYSKIQMTQDGPYMGKEVSPQNLN